MLYYNKLFLIQIMKGIIMENNKERDADRILGMNRTMFFVIVILLCILSLSIGIYAQVFYRYSETDPFMLGIGVGKTQDAAEVTKLKNEFNNIFTNDLSGESTVKNIKKEKNDKPVVYTLQNIVEKEENEYNINANIPKININSSEAKKINDEIEKKYVQKIEDIIEFTDEYTDYSVTYKAYLNGDLLSIIIKETIREGKQAQSAKIATYNYNLTQNKMATINDIIKAKDYNTKTLQKEIDAEIKDLNKKDEELKNQYTEVRLRDTSSSMYKIENTENFIVNTQGYVYLIYAYGNTENTNKIDIIIFE